MTGAATSLRPPLVVLALTIFLLIAPGYPARAVDQGTVTWSVVVGGRDADSIDSNDPLRVLTTEPLPLVVSVVGSGDEIVRVSAVQFQGRVLGLTFFNYRTQVNLEARSGDSVDRNFTLDLGDLRGQATGLIPSSVALIGDEGDVIASKDFPVDIRGSFASVYGTFGLAVAAVTLLLLLSALWRLSKGKLPPNRWQRAMTFLAPGLGIGFVLTFTLSALHLLVPTPGAWAMLIAVGAAVGFTTGYLTPTPLPSRIGEEERIASDQGDTDEFAVPELPVVDGTSGDRQRLGERS